MCNTAEANRLRRCMWSESSVVEMICADRSTMTLFGYVIGALSRRDR